MSHASHRELREDQTSTARAPWLQLAADQSSAFCESLQALPRAFDWSAADRGGVSPRRRPLRTIILMVAGSLLIGSATYALVGRIRGAPRPYERRHRAPRSAGPLGPRAPITVAAEEDQWHKDKRPASRMGRAVETSAASEPSKELPLPVVAQRAPEPAKLVPNKSPVVPRKIEEKRDRPRRRPSRLRSNGVYEFPDEIIVVRPRTKCPPLFDPQVYRRRR